MRDGSGRCAQHPRAAWSKPANSTKRITGRKLQRLRAELFTRDPLCVMCREQGIVKLATQRDHIKPLAEGGTEDDDNTQGLCTDHNKEKGLAEALRGRARRAW